MKKFRILFIFVLFISTLISCTKEPAKPKSVYQAPGVVQKTTDVPTSFTVAEYKGWVSDYENIYSADQNVILTNMISNYEKKTGVELVVLTVPSYESDISDYAVTTFKKWGIGKKGINNGLLLVISKNNRKFFACTGYGLEGYLPDGWLKVTEEDCFPSHFKAGEYYEGTKEFLSACMSKIGDAYSVDVNKKKATENPSPSGSSNILLWIIIGIVVLVIIIVIVAVAAGGGGGGYSSGGFFSSDGGGFGSSDSGGGGFGGFGGGSSGGGGAGGSW